MLSAGRRQRIAVAAAIAMLPLCGTAQAQNPATTALPPLQRADLLFFSDTSGMGSAVSASTGHYTHVAIVETVGDTIWIIDATPTHGVSRRPLEQVDEGTPEVYRLTMPIDTTAVLHRATMLVGRPYDEAFMPGDEALYCSELVYECYRDTSGVPLFHTAPMNWRDSRGRLPRYWRRHFRKLGRPVPEGVAGTNPTGLSSEPLLIHVDK